MLKNAVRLTANKLIFGTLFFYSPLAHSETFQNVQIVSVHDGDTFQINLPHLPAVFGKKISVRVLGIDTPEMHGKLPCEQERAKEAQQVAEKLLRSAKHVTLKNIGRDKYFRLLADVYADDQSLKALLLSKNLAYAYDGGTKVKTNWCLKGE